MNFYPVRNSPPKPEGRASAGAISNGARLANISKSYDGTATLTDINIEIKPNEFVSIIGQNASGKSTLLKIIAGVIPATSGSVNVAGEISYMPQDHALLPWRTVEENLYLPTDIRGASDGPARQRIHTLLSEFGLQHYAQLYPASLSGGTRQKIALLRTVLQDHSLLLLDEPFAPLDALSRIEAEMWLLALLEKTETSTLFVTHDIREAILLSDRIYVLRKGKIVDMIPVLLPKPRRHEQLSSPPALALEKKLFTLLV